jgi:hypothetical protein
VSLFERSRGFSRGFRLVAAAAAIAGLASAGFVVACGSSDGGAAADGEGGTTGEAGSGVDSGDPTEGVPDGGIYMSHADAGCPVKYAGPNPGTIAVSVPRTGATGVPWAGPANALTVDGQYARSIVTDGEQTELLRVTGFSFKVPANVIIKGVVVELKRQGDNKIVDGNIELWLDGVASDRPKFVASGWPTKIGTHHYGQEVDTWGNDLTPELVGRAGFGTEIFAKRREDAGTSPVPAEIESLLITIWYCDP